MLTRLRGAQYTRRTKRACIGTASIARLKSADRTRRQIVAGAIRARTLPVLRRSTGAPRKLAVMHSRSSEGAMSAFGPGLHCEMSAFDPKRTWHSHCEMSSFGVKRTQLLLQRISWTICLPKDCVRCEAFSCNMRKKYRDLFYKRQGEKI